MSEILGSPLFGILITMIAYQIGVKLYSKYKIGLLNPVIFGTVSIIIFLLLMKIDYSFYKFGGDFIQFFLGPSTIILAVPLYKQLDKLKRHVKPILVGIVSGSMFSILSSIIAGKILKLDEKLIVSIIPKSITTPIGLELSRIIGGVPSITFISIAIAGFSGPVIAGMVFKVFRVKSKIARGVALGTASHAVGTTKAIDMGEVEGAMSGLAIGVAGLTTVLLGPILYKILM
jgi:predicted murein hydrolase (TIGR00659 family)